MKIYYETHKDLFEAVQKWEENWKLFLELEVLSRQEHGKPWVRVYLCSPGTALWEGAGSHWGVMGGQCRDEVLCFEHWGVCARLAPLGPSPCEAEGIGWCVCASSDHPALPE